MTWSDVIDRFIETTDTSVFKHRDVAKEVVHLLRAYKTIHPFHVGYVVQAIGWSTSEETTSMESIILLAGMLMADGWIQYAAEPWAGKGLATVYSYELTDKGKQLIYKK